jgi:putative molybdopterin biosynthesis protein
MTRRAAPETPQHEYLTAREAADYLRLNEKKVYALVKDGAIPATKVAGKWLFPKRLMDEWLMESTHGGALTDRLVIGGSDDPLLAAAVAFLAADVGAEAMVTLCPTGTRLGLELLSRRRANVCGIHWGPADLADRVHGQLLRPLPGHRDWTLVRMARRRQGIILGGDVSEAAALPALLHRKVRWALRQEGSGSQHFLQTALLAQGHDFAPARALTTALSERHAAALIAQGAADCAPGVQSAAAEFGLGFLPLGWECFDLVLPKSVYFRQLFQRLMSELRGERVQGLAAALGGYDLLPLGSVVSLPSD